METLIWMGFLGVVGLTGFFWTAHNLYWRFVDWRRKVKPVEGYEHCAGLMESGAIAPQNLRGANPRGQHILAGLIAGVLTNIVLSLIAARFPGGRVVVSALHLVALMVSVWAGVWVYRLLQRRRSKKKRKLKSKGYSTPA